MPHFTDQDRPKKVKEIYRALKRDHPDMPAEMKARIAARQGKKGKQHQGPPYKGPITKTSGENTEKRGYVMVIPTYHPSDAEVASQKPWSAGRAAAIGGLAGGTLGAAAGIPLGAKGALVSGLAGGALGLASTPLLQALNKRGITKARERLKNKYIEHARARQAAAAEMAKQGALKIALQNRAADLRNDIVNRALACGEALEKTAAEQFFHDLRKPDQDVEMLGQEFCKLAHGIGRDPWELALEVADNFPSYAVLSKTASDPQVRELANFYLDWSDEMEKTAFLGKAWQMGKAGLGALAQKAKGLTSSGKMTQAISGQPQHTVRGAMRRAGKQYEATRALGGGSYSRGAAVRQAEKAERAATAAKPAPAPAAQPQAAAGAQPTRQDIYNAYTAKPSAPAPAAAPAAQGRNWGRVAIGAGAVGGTGAAGLYAYNKLKGQPQPAQGYGY